MKNDNQNAQNLILKSIINEFINYSPWKKQKEELCLEIEAIDRQLYEVRGINFDGIPQKNKNNDYESRLIELLTKKQKLLEQIDFIQCKEEFVNKLLSYMSIDDKEFIFKSLIYRSAYDTNDSIGTRNEITESGVRYKVNTIVKKAYDAYLAEEKKEGGMIESITV